VSDVVDGETCSFAECGGTSVDAVLMTEDLKHAFSDGTGADKLTLLLDRMLHCPLKAVVQYVYSELSGSDATVAVVNDDHRTLLTEKRTENDFAEMRHKISASGEMNNTFSTMSDPPLNDRRQPCLIRGTDSMKFDEKSHSGNVCGTSPPPVKRPKIGLDRAAKFNIRSTCTATDGESSMINCHSIAETDDNDGKNDDCDGNDDDVKSKPSDVSCACQAMLSSSIGGSVRRVFCKDCYQLTRLKSPSDDFSKLLLLCYYSLLRQKAAQLVQ